MTGRLPRITAGEAQRVLEHGGFQVVRQKGSHRILRDPAGHRVILPYHAEKTLHPKILEAIIEDAGLPREAFEG
jgi:predicted RNA binding protein YcfA (HicA-like mRNA interferase family)